MADSASQGELRTHVNRRISRVTLVVPDYDEAIYYYTSVLDLVVTEDREIPEQSKRWVTIAPSAASAVELVLGKASDGRQRSRGVRFVREPQQFDYGTVAVFEDRYGNRWDLLGSAGIRLP